MKTLNRILDLIRQIVRAIMTVVAKILVRLTGGRLTANFVTWAGLLAHIPIALLIATQHNWLAAVLLIVFGSFDALDGALARVLGTSSARGMLLDATSDRLKETLIYSGLAYSFIGLGHPKMVIWAVAACGASLSVSYIKAKGETAVRDNSLTVIDVNQVFKDGLMRFEVRMAIVVVGLLTHHTTWACVLIAVASLFTVFERLQGISNILESDEKLQS